MSPACLPYGQPSFQGRKPCCSSHSCFSGKVLDTFIGSTSSRGGIYYLPGHISTVYQWTSSLASSNYQRNSLLKLYFLLCVCVCLYGAMHTWLEEPMEATQGCCNLEMELQVLFSHCTWVLGIKLSSLCKSSESSWSLESSLWSKTFQAVTLSWVEMISQSNHFM